VKPLPEDKCWICGRQGLNYKHFYRRMLISSLKLKLIGEKPESPHFVKNLNAGAQAGGNPILVAVVMDNTFKAACPNEDLLWDAVEQDRDALVCGQCLVRFKLTQARMLGVDVIDPDELLEEARAELREEISEFLQKSLDSW